MHITELIITSIDDLIREVRILLKENIRWIFRGQSNSKWGLIPSVRRDYSPQQERYLTNEFRVRALSRNDSCPSGSDYSGWLALMQHYGLPTRLLDWSYSPLNACFFALHPDFSETKTVGASDVCIWALAARLLNESQGFEPLVYPMDAKTFEPLIEPAFKERTEPNTIGVAMGVENNVRIQVQQGAFTIHSSQIPLNEITGCDKWLNKFIISKDIAADFLENIEILGIRKQYLFPDLASLASDLKAIHSK